MSAIRLFAALWLLSLSMPAAALTLGDLVVHSVPGEPLKASVPIILLADEAIDRIQVGVAPAEEYTRQKLERPASLEKLRAVLLAKGENGGRIQLYGENPWQGGEVILLLQLQWPGGEMTQHYRIAPANETAATPLYVEVAQDESLADIAIRLSKHSNRSYLYMMVALYRANPDAFYRENLNRLKAGAQLRVPSDEVLYQLDDAEVNAVLQEHEQRFQAERQQRSAAQERKRELEQELEQVTRKSAALEQHNRELKERLARLEQQVDSMSQQVLKIATQPAGETAPAKDAEPAVTEKEPEGLSTLQMFLLLLLALFSVFALRRLALRRKGRR